MVVRKLPQQGRTDGLTEKWYGVFTDHIGALRRLPLFVNRKASNEAASKVAKLVDLRAAGDTLPSELAKWVETMPPKMLNRLSAWGIIDAKRTASSKPLKEHVADWKAALLAKGGTARHADQVTGRALKAFEGCGFTY